MVAHASIRASLVIVAFLLLPTAQAAVASGTADAVSFEQPVDIHGALSGLATAGSACGTLRIEGTAHAAHAEVDKVRHSMNLATPRGDVTLLPSDNQTTHRWDFNDVELTVQARQGCRILVVPSGEVSWSATTRIVTSLHGVREDFGSQASTRRAPTIVDTRDAFVATADGTSILEGDLLLVLWDTTGEMWSGSSRMSLATGETVEPMHPGGIQQQQIYNSTGVEAYLWLEDARLTLHTDAAVPLRHASVEARDGTAMVEQPSFSVRDDKVQGGLMAVEAPLTLGLDGSAGRLNIAVQKASGVSVDGVGVDLSQAHPWRAVAWTVGAVALVLLGAVALVRQRVHVATACLDRHDYEGTIRATRGMTRMPWWGARLAVARTVAFLRSGRHDEARACLDAPRRWRGDTPTRHYLYANLHAACGDRRRAVEHLAECIALQPSYRLDAMADPHLRPVVQEALSASAVRRGQWTEGYT